MDKTQIKEIIIEAFTDLLETENINLEVNESTPLMGKNSIIDSLGLVTLLVDVEGRLSEEDIEISILSEKAMSQKNSPFISVDSLADYIKEQIN